MCDKVRRLSGIQWLGARYALGQAVTGAQAFPGLSILRDFLGGVGLGDSSARLMPVLLPWGCDGIMVLVEEWSGGPRMGT